MRRSTNADKLKAEPEEANRSRARRHSETEAIQKILDAVRQRALQIHENKHGNYRLTPGDIREAIRQRVPGLYKIRTRRLRKKANKLRPSLLTRHIRMAVKTSEATMRRWRRENYIPRAVVPGYAMDQAFRHLLRWVDRGYRSPSSDGVPESDNTAEINSSNTEAEPMSISPNPCGDRSKEQESDEDPKTDETRHDVDTDSDSDELAGSSAEETDVNTAALSSEGAQRPSNPDTGERDTPADSDPVHSRGSKGVKKKNNVSSRKRTSGQRTQKATEEFMEMESQKFAEMTIGSPEGSPPKRRAEKSGPAAPTSQAKGRGQSRSSQGTLESRTSCAPELSPSGSRAQVPAVPGAQAAVSVARRTPSLAPQAPAARADATGAPGPQGSSSVDIKITLTEPDSPPRTS